MANKPNNPTLWSKAKSLAKEKYDVYPSAYANGWAAKWYKNNGGTWSKAAYGMQVPPMMQQGGEPDGAMALGQIDASIDKLMMLRKFIQPDSDLEPWVSSKLTLMDHYTDAVSDYMQYNPEALGTVPEEQQMFMEEGGGIPERYKNMGFSRVGQKKDSTSEGKKWMVLAKKGDQYKVVHGGYDGMQDYTQHRNEQRRKNFWNRMGGKDSAKANDPFSPLYWHKRFGTWQEGGDVPAPIPTPYSREYITDYKDSMNMPFLISEIMNTNRRNEIVPSYLREKYKKGGSTWSGNAWYSEGGEYDESENFMYPGVSVNPYDDLNSYQPIYTSELTPDTDVIDPPVTDTLPRFSVVDPSKIVDKYSKLLATPAPATPTPRKKQNQTSSAVNNQTSQTTSMVVKLLGSQGLPSDYESRKALASRLGINDYRSTEDQNLQLIYLIGQMGQQNNQTNRLPADSIILQDQPILPVLDSIPYDSIPVPFIDTAGMPGYEKDFVNNYLFPRIENNGVDTGGVKVPVIDLEKEKNTSSIYPWLVGAGVVGGLGASVYGANKLLNSDLIDDVPKTAEELLKRIRTRGYRTPEDMLRLKAFKLTPKQILTELKGIPINKGSVPELRYSTILATESANDVLYRNIYKKLKNDIKDVQAIYDGPKDLTENIYAKKIKLNKYKDASPKELAELKKNISAKENLKILRSAGKKLINIIRAKGYRLPNDYDMLLDHGLTQTEVQQGLKGIPFASPEQLQAVEEGIDNAIKAPKTKRIIPPASKPTPRPAPRMSATPKTNVNIPASAIAPGIPEPVFVGTPSSVAATPSAASPGMTERAAMMLDEFRKSRVAGALREGLKYAKESPLMQAGKYLRYLNLARGRKEYGGELPYFQTEGEYDGDEWYDNFLVQLLDPTGVTSWPTVKRTFNDPNATGWDKSFSVLGALPMIGKVGKGMKVVEKAPGIWNKTKRGVSAVFNAIDKVGTYPARQVEHISPIHRVYVGATEKLLNKANQKGVPAILMNMSSANNLWTRSMPTYGAAYDGFTNLIGYDSVPPPKKSKGGIHINPKNKGTFKAQATRMGMSTQEAAAAILNAPVGKYSPEMRKKANFARNFAKEFGGPVVGDEMDVTPEQLEELIRNGYQFEMI